MLQRHRTVFGTGIVVFAGCLLLSSAVRAQDDSGIAGVVRDASGAVMPGVTVEVTSPVLIEKVRSVVTDGGGRFSIVELRPGTYVVTFTLPGFSTIRREGIVLTAGFTATVNADLQVGRLEETITVTGASPLVDTQNVRVITVISDKLLSELPTSTSALSNLITLTPGLTGTTDVGGSSGLYKSNTPSSDSLHGKTGSMTLFDGMNTMGGTGGFMTYIVNPAAAEETTVETSGFSAESSVNAIQISMVPKEGGNTFNFRVAGIYGGEHLLQSNNLTDDLRALGVTEPPTVYHVYDFNATAGGPIKRDRLWFFIVNREAGNKNLVPGVYFNETQGTPVYTPDLDRPAFRKEWMKTIGGRLTWQASQKNKISGFADYQELETRGRGEFTAMEAMLYLHHIHPTLAQASWSSPVTSRLLLEAGTSYLTGGWPYAIPGEGDYQVGPDDVSIRESSTGFQYNAKASYNSIQEENRHVQRFSASYVTGSHNFKAGINSEVAISNGSVEINGGDVTYTFLRGVPNTITMRATPYLLKSRNWVISPFVQDRWAIKRLTVNYGLRLDRFVGWVPDQHVDARRFVQDPVDFPSRDDIPKWTTWNPRMGASYDLFGDGRTALKVSFGRYVPGGSGGLTANPITDSVTTTNRTWNDTNGNYVPDCVLSNFSTNGECGGIDNLNFGQNNPRATRYSDEVLRGYRSYTWDLTTEVQREIRPGISVTGGYYRNRLRNYRVTDNLDVISGDYSPFCVTAPVDARLPGGGGYPVCGLFDVAPAKFGQVTNLVTKASDYFAAGDADNCDGTSLSGCTTSNHVGVSVRARWASGIQVNGAVDTGNTVTENCLVVDSPQQLLNCRVEKPVRAQTQVKVFGSVPLPGEFIVSATVQNIPGAAIGANYQARNVEVAPTLGRDLAACGSRTGAACTSTVTVPLYAPNTLLLPRATFFDMRFSKVLRLGAKNRLQVNADLYNVLNASTLLGVNDNYGPQWQYPFSAFGTVDSIMPGRILQVGGQLTF